MTLARRLGLSLFLLTVGTLLALGLGVREAWRLAEARSFEDSFQQALGPLQEQLAHELSSLPELILPLCQDDPLVDSALVGLLRGDLAERKLPISLRVPKLSRALTLDELVLVTSNGEVIGSSAEGEVGTRKPELARKIENFGAQARLQNENGKLSVAAACLRRDPVRTKQWVGVQATRELDPLLRRVSISFGTELSLQAPPSSENVLRRRIVLPRLAGLSINAWRSRRPLLSAVRELDLTVLAIAAATLATALVASVLLSRGLARPVKALAEQAQRIVRGDPTPISESGPTELVEAAAAFNRAIADLVTLRRRLAVTERIAARREIARRVAHEIKNPLLPIRAAVETLRRLRARSDPAFDEYFEEATRTVLDEVARIARIVAEFTEFARLPAPQLAPFDAEAAVRAVVQLHRGGDAELELETEPCPPLVADREQLVQVVTNLVQNALAAVAPVANGKVVVALRSRGERLELSVTDNGPGVTPEMQARLFEPYATTKAEGTGLGLSIVERIVNEHGGEIRYEEPETGGARFVVTLPFAGPGLLTQPPAESGGEGLEHW